MATVRVELRLRGRVQGVGLRPWCARRAAELGLGGSARNEGEGLALALEGERARVSRFLGALYAGPPAGARVEEVSEARRAPRGERAFRILPSPAAGAGARTRVPPDVALCAACAAELFDPEARRHRYAFTHCADCGPRASVLRALPYDRERTALADFPLCARCRREYESPADRRFHAETIACPDCGPRLAARAPDGRELSGDPVELAAAALAEGGIVALAGYGGYHLAALAGDAGAVARLRARKGRPAKPFALLVPELGTAEVLVRLGPADRALLAPPLAAVVIAPRREPPGRGAPPVAEAVAPRTRDLGLLLPSSPLHHLLLFAPGARPGRDAPRFGALVLTSANRSGEPTEHEAAGARERLAGVADVFVDHDRAVVHPSDDPVFRSAPPGPLPVRLSRGTSPRVFPLPFEAPGAPPLLAVGGDLKCAPALCLDGEVHLAPHVGDLGTARAAEALEARLAALARDLGAKPEAVAHDAHPGYVGTALARGLGPQALPVQHHFAHALAALVEHGRAGPALALVLDGAGWGADGTLWGGELLWVAPGGFDRLAHLEAVPLPGGDRAVREPWRAAAAWLDRAFAEGGVPRLDWHARREPRALEVVRRMARRGWNAPESSACGRLFDAAASLLGCGDAVTHEGEAAVALESLAAGAPDGLAEEAPPAPAAAENTIPAADLVRALALGRARGEPAARAAARFHAHLAARLADAALAAVRRTGAEAVALTGGCFQNRILLEAVRARLAARGARPLGPRRLPPNDAGLAVGQAAAAGARWAPAVARPAPRGAAP